MTDRTIHNNWPDIPLVLLDKANKEAYLIDVAIPNRYKLHSTITKKHEVCRRSYENVETENGLYNTISTINNG
jgi:hypothetical protein